MITSDLMLRQHVENELGWEPSLNSETIGVGVHDAVVTLSGCVESFAQKHTAGKVVTSIRGVRAVANELEVKLPVDSERSDENIAHAIASIFAWNSAIPKNKVGIELSQGWVTLAGSVEWNFQRTAAESAVRGLLGVKGITNLITVKGKTVHDVPHSRLEAAIGRKDIASMEPIALRIDGGTVVVAGKVSSLALKGYIEQIAWNFPGVTYVENLLDVEPEAEAVRDR